MAIVDWPEDERPREKLMQRGATALSDAELLGILLHTGFRNTTAIGMARELLRELGGLVGVLGAERQRLLAMPGVGLAKYAQMQAALELARRHALETLTAGDVLTSPQQTRQFLQYHLAPRNREVFSCLFLDSQHRVLACEDLFLGTLDGAAVYPREVATRALQHRAGAVILAHNHPSGVAEPSSADRRITQRLQSALGLLDIRVLDHIIIGRGQHDSFAEAGLL